MTRRPLILVLVLVFLVGGLVADRSPRPKLSAAAAQPGLAMPVAAAASALSSTWYCPAGGRGDTSIVMANPTGAPATGTVTLMGSDGGHAVTSVVVPRLGRLALKEKDLLSAPYVAALVVLDGGEVTAEQSVVTGVGTITTACSSTSSDHWYLADGSTAKDAGLLLALFNPLAIDAVVDLSFSTEQGPTSPLDFQGVVVPARSLLVEDIGGHVRRRDHVATSVTARAGRVVVAGIQSFAESSPVKGAAITLGTPSLGQKWYFPEGYVNPGVSERYWFYNPGKRDAEVELTLDLERGSAEPFDLTVRAGGDLALDVNGESRIPPGVSHGARVRSTNGVPFVVARTITATAPSPRVGFSTLVGARLVGRRWLAAAGGATDTLDDWVVVQNPGSRSVAASIFGLAGQQLLPIEGLQHLDLPAHSRKAFRLGDHIKRADLPVLVTATGDVVVERDLYGSGSPGFTAALAVPLP